MTVDQRESVRTSPAAWLVALVPAMAAVGVGGLALGGADLPERVASHWGSGGQPDGSAPAGLLWGLLVVAGLGLLPVVGALLRSPDRSSAPPPVVAGTWWALFFALLVAQMALANDGLVDWRDAPALTGLRGGTTLLGVVVVPIAVAALTGVWLRHLLPTRPRPAREADDALPSLGLAPGEVATWSQSVSFGWLGALTIVTTVLGAVVGFLASAVVGWVLVLTALPIALLMTRFRVQVGAEGLTIRFGWLGWPRQRFPLHEVERALVEPDLVRMQWGGWGYRGSLAVAGRAAIVHRRGPAMVVELTEGRRFAVTCDDPEVGAGLLNDLLARAGGPAPR